MPLTPEDRGRTDRVARRLHSELAAFLAVQPPTARHASALARHLGVDRTTCQRAVHGATRPYPGPELLARLPGVRALRMLADAATRSTPPADPAAVDALVTAIDQYQRLLASLGGSLTRLMLRLERSQAAPGEHVAEPVDRSALDARVRLFEAATEVTGRASDCWVAVYAYRPSPTDPGMVEVYRANGLIGHVAGAEAVPLVVHNFSGSQGEQPATGEARFASLENDPVTGRSATVVLEGFSSDPPPLVTARQPDEFLVQSIDEREPAAGRAVDLMLATRTAMPHPALGALPVDEVWALVNFPCRHLLLDVYLHRDLARACVPSLDAHLWGPDFGKHQGDRWQTRFADPPPLQLLGPGLPRRSPAAYPRLAELTQHLFSRVSLPSDEFVGHRCDVAYPLWRAGYCMRLDYTPPEH